MAGSAHFIAGNAGARIPGCHIAFDCESWRNGSSTGERHTFRLAVAECWRRHDKGRPWGEPQRGEFETPAALWDWVADHAPKNGRCVVVAHNLAYDLRVAQVFAHLPALGFTVTRFGIGGGHFSMKWTRGKTTLHMVDSMAWLPTGLGTLGELVGVRKPALPADDAPRDVWLERCRADVAILAECWRRLLDWIERDRLGNWRPSGAAQAEAAWRHRFYTMPVLCQPHYPTRQAEREAAWTGRTEAWRHGRLRGGPWTEWDYQAAYCRIAAYCSLPTIQQGWTHAKGAEAALRPVMGRRTLIRGVVTTKAPVVPCRGAQGVIWPVGTFETTLWDCEARLVLATGGTFEASTA